MSNSPVPMVPVCRWPATGYGIMAAFQIVARSDVSGAADAAKVSACFRAVHPLARERRLKFETVTKKNLFEDFADSLFAFDVDEGAEVVLPPGAWNWLKEKLDAHKDVGSYSGALHRMHQSIAGVREEEAPVSTRDAAPLVA